MNIFRTFKELILQISRAENLDNKDFFLQKKVCREKDSTEGQFD